MWGWLKRHREVIAYGLLVVALIVPNVLFIRLEDGRRYDACVSRQNLYDGEVAIVTLAAKELNATPAETRMALDDLYDVIGERPLCGPH